MPTIATQYKIALGLLLAQSCLMAYDTYKYKATLNSLSGKVAELVYNTYMFECLKITRSTEEDCNQQAQTDLLPVLEIIFNLK